MLSGGKHSIKRIGNLRQQPGAQLSYRAADFIFNSVPVHWKVQGAFPSRRHKQH